MDKVPEPVLTWLGPGQRIELSGPVARRWIAKTDNFLASELPYGGERFSVLLPNHWRLPFWLAVPWLRGMTLVSPGEAVDIDLVVSNDLGFLQGVRDEGGPDTLVAQSLDSMNTSWGPDLPPEFLDGMADVATFGDYVEDPTDAPQGARLVADNIEWVAPNLWEQTDQQNLPIESLRGLTYLGTVKDTRAGQVLSPSHLPEKLEGARVLVRTGNPVLFAAQLVQLWLAGAKVIWAPGETVRERIDQEKPDLELLPLS